MSENRASLDKTKDRTFRRLEDTAPAKFRTFFKTQLFDQFISTLILYFVALFQGMALDHKKEFYDQATMNKVQREAQLQMERLGPLYARIIMTQSDYKHTQQDKLFFESLYEACNQILQDTFSGQRRMQELEVELGKIFRTRSFNIARRRNEQKQDLTIYSLRELYALKNEGDLTSNARLLASVTTKPQSRSVSRAGSNCSKIINAMLPSVIEQFEESFQTIQRQGREGKQKGPSGGIPARSPSPRKAGLVRRSSSFFGQNTEAIFDENLQSLESIKRSVSHSDLAYGA